MNTRTHTEFYIGFNPYSTHHPLRHPISIPNILRDNEVPWPLLRVAEVAWQSQPSSLNTKLSAQMRQWNKRELITHFCPQIWQFPETKDETGGWLQALQSPSGSVLPKGELERSCPTVYIKGNRASEEWDLPKVAEQSLVPKSGENREVQVWVMKSHGRCPVKIRWMCRLPSGTLLEPAAGRIP